MEVNLGEIERFLGYKETEPAERFVCLLAGQFSAGKTKFLNRLMGKDYLPVGTVETTAAPTYVSKGEGSAFLYGSDGTRTEVPVENVKAIRKGKCDCEKIEMEIPDLPFSEKVTLIDTPGINSLSSWHEEKLMELAREADAVFYFLAKSLSLSDVSAIGQILSQKEGKLIVVRTGIDKIKASEEDRQITYAGEEALVKSIYPYADFYFVSLEQEETELNQIYALETYVSREMERQLGERREILQDQYIKEVLLPALNRMKEGAGSGQRPKSFDPQKRLKRQLREISRKFGEKEEEIREQFLTAKENYIKNGEAFIEKKAGEHIPAGREIQSYVLGCVGKLEEWFGLEFEDILSDMARSDWESKIKRLITEEAIDQILSKFGKKKRFFTELYFTEGDTEDADLEEWFETTAGAKRYLNKLVNRIFNRLDADFGRIFEERMEAVKNELEAQYGMENEILQKYAALPDGEWEEKKEKIDQYIGELLDYGRDKEAV